MLHTHQKIGKITCLLPFSSSLVQLLLLSQISLLPSHATSQLKLNCSSFKRKRETSGFVSVLILLNTTITFLFKTAVKKILLHIAMPIVFINQKHV